MSEQSPAPTDQSEKPKESKSISEKGKEEVLRVGNGTDCKSLANSISIAITKGAKVAIEYIGAGAGQQAIKGICLANTNLSRVGKYLSAVPVFVSREIKGDMLTGIQLRLVVHEL
jgi:stage V sporulation protein SpoVS